MRIKEFIVTRYGPLVDLERFYLKDFNLFFGRNEEGKTLLIDSIVRFLFKRVKKTFNKIERVDETPEGYLIMEMEDGKTIKFPEKGELTEVTGLSIREYRDIFIIRSSDLSIDDENAFYRNVQNRLTGLRTDEIERIHNHLLDIGKLTPKERDFRDKKDENLKAKLLNAKKLIERIERLKKEIEKEGFESLEEELFNKKKIIESIDGKLNDYENARKRETYEKCNVALNSLKMAGREIKNLEIFNDEKEKLWRDTERDIEKYIEEKCKLENELTNKEVEFKEKKKEIGKKERDFHVYIDRKKRLDEDVYPEIKNYEKASQEIAKGKGIHKTLTILNILFGFLCSISIIGYILKQSSPLGFSIAVFGTITIALLIVLLFFLRKKAGLAGTLEKIKLISAKLGLSSKTIDDILFSTRRFQEEFSKMENERNNIEKDLTVVEREIKKIKEEIPELHSEINKGEKDIEEIKRKSGVGAKEEYTEKLLRKSEQEKVKDKEKGILKSYFGIDGKTEEDRIQYWKTRIDEYEVYMDKAAELNYDEKTVSRLKNKKNSLIEEEKEIKKRMSNFMDELKDVEKRTSNIIPSEEDYLHCRTTIDLDAIKERLNSFIEENNRKRETVMNVMEIFEEIEKEEEEKVSSLFGKDSNVSAYFRKITEGMYENVEYDAENGSIEVFPRKGQRLSAEKLSSGAYDQLYLSIRLALGEKILKGEKGFFIMDDPFVKSDINRLKRQLSILRELSKTGWQILYFTAKEEIKDCLKDEIKKKQISYFEI